MPGIETVSRAGQLSNIFAVVVTFSKLPMIFIEDKLTEEANIEFTRFNLFEKVIASGIFFNKLQPENIFSVVVSFIKLVGIEIDDIFLHK